MTGRRGISLHLLSWRTYLPVFLIWIVFEDTFRKYSSGNILIYFVKDALLLWTYLLYLFAHPKSLMSWPRAAFWAPLAAYFVVAVVQSFNSALPDPRIAMIGLRNMFIYVPLVMLAYAYVRDQRDFDRLLKVLAVLAIIAALGGIGQALFGAQFINPVEIAPRYNFDRVRGLALRTNSIFIDTGRFIYYLIFMFYGLLGGYLVSVRTRRPLAQRALVGSALALVIVAILTAGSRSSIVAMAVGLLVMVVTTSPSRTFFLALGAIAATFVLFQIDAEKAHNALSFITSHVLDESSWTSRTESLIRGYSSPLLDRYWWTGRGTGTVSQGTNFLLPDAIHGAPESALGALIMMFGAIIIPIWVWLNIAWIYATAKIARRCAGGPYYDFARAVMLLVMVYLAILNLLGYQAYENYTAIIHFWLFIGIALKLAVLSNNRAPVSAATPRDTLRLAEPRSVPS